MSYLKTNVLDCWEGNFQGVGITILLTSLTRPLIRLIDCSTLFYDIQLGRRRNVVFEERGGKRKHVIRN